LFIRRKLSSIRVAPMGEEIKNLGEKRGEISEAGGAKGRGRGVKERGKQRTVLPKNPAGSQKERVGGKKGRN